MRTVLFFRRYRSFHGGHLKVWDYFTHVLATPGFDARIGFDARSTWDAGNPWRAAPRYVVDAWRDVRPDLFFVAGRDWQLLDRHPDADRGLPVLNLIQHVRHAEEDHPKTQFLSRRAIRICVADEVADALHATGRVEGPVVVIPNGIDVGDASVAEEPREVDLLIAGLKQPALAATLAQRLAAPGRRLDVLTEPLPRPDFLARLGRARTTVFLPNETEGFYLPALEGLALGTLVVCPDCVGNRSYLQTGGNGFRPAYRADAIVEAAGAALALTGADRDRLLAGARETARGYGLERERAAFQTLLGRLHELW